jgi:hypothetical protein
MRAYAQGDYDMTPMPPDQAITITLEAQQWNVVLGALNEAPYRIAAPLINKIVEQVQQQEPQPALAAKPNGADEHAPH